MLMEGTGKYFFMLFIVFLIVYITVKICLASLFKRAKEKKWKAYIPFYTTYVLVDLLTLQKKVFYFTLIPFVNLYYYYIIIQKLLEGFKQDPKEAIWYLLIPMYKFPELVYKRQKFINNEYDLTKEFVETQKLMFEKKAEELPDQINIVVENQPDDSNDTVFNYNESEISESEIEEIKIDEPVIEKPKINKVPSINIGPSICPNCGAKLAPNSSTCFFCGKKLS